MRAAGMPDGHYLLGDYRVEMKDSKVAGTGLGLAISQGIVKAHGGNVRAEPGLNGAGTCIVISLPIDEPPLIETSGP
jgi:two-component system sensor histidine kinase KdpD